MKGNADAIQKNIKVLLLCCFDDFTEPGLSGIGG